jgi:hypothetical protein
MGIQPGLCLLAGGAGGILNKEHTASPFIGKVFRLSL